MAKSEAKKELSPEECDELLGTLRSRFEKNTNRHKDLEWAKVQAKLNQQAARGFRGSLRV